MAKFVLAGKADCPLYAQAERLADTLQRTLPNFKVHKIPVLPSEWEVVMPLPFYRRWLELTCNKNGWKHEESPLIWRELVEQGGKGMILGGYNDFVDHCQVYYGVTSKIPDDEMETIVAENLETQLSLIAEEQHRLSLIHPCNVWITGALCLTSQILIPFLLSDEAFPDAQTVALHLLHLSGDEEDMQTLKLDTEDLALGLLYRVTVHTDLEQAFHEAHVVILLDDFNADSENESDEARKQRVKNLSERYREYGRLIDGRADKEVKVMVSGMSFVNMRCSLLVESAPSINSHQFVAIASQLVNEVRAVLADKLCVMPSDVKDVIVWGNISGRFVIDLRWAKVFNYPGAIRVPPSFSQPVLRVLYDRKWLETEFKPLVHQQRQILLSNTGRGAAISATNGILQVLKAWHGAYGPDEFFSVGITCTDFYSLPHDIIISAPVTCTEGKWSLLKGVTVEGKMLEELDLCANELQQEKETQLQDPV
ncbi:PREDICTED: putative malate dehydrogenase 1B isoform X1 [Poecilia mexicana]|uniref:putative malate dehydrogenase 1B isoform X1 n=2 Tax=Poecilia mexicana TaxID=48701 RepID=UPI00072E2A38|nr:PREDICTED: putative malate dehydrogenase 1B isoform X1 [Poecilia mexicana]